MSSAPSPALAAVLSFVFPGLGQAYAGRRRSALIQALPALALVAIAIKLDSRGQGMMREMLLNPLRAGYKAFLRGAGASVALPLLDSMVPAGRARAGRRARAALPRAG